MIGADLSGGFWSARGALGQQTGEDHEIVGEHRDANKQYEALGAFGAATLHAAPATVDLLRSVLSLQPRPR